MTEVFRDGSNDCPPAVGATEGQNIAVVANANPTYPGSSLAGKQKHALDSHRRDRASAGRIAATAAFRSLAGRLWRYSGKRGRVLALLATSASGVTQWDTLPWYTRLGGTIHALRKAGLAIETERQGEYGHARYRLRTSGSLLIHRNKRGEA